MNKFVEGRPRGSLAVGDDDDDRREWERRLLGSPVASLSA